MWQRREVPAQTGRQEVGSGRGMGRVLRFAVLLRGAMLPYVVSLTRELTSSQWLDIGWGVKR